MSALVFNSGMTGSSETSLLNAMPGTGQGSDKNTSAPPLYQSEPIQPELMPSNIDVSTRRNVLPCKGITHYVLRPQPPPAAAGMIPIGGVGRHQQPALSQERPTDLPILKFSDPFASQFNSPLGQPA